MSKKEEAFFMLRYGTPISRVLWHLRLVAVRDGDIVWRRVNFTKSRLSEVK